MNVPSAAQDAFGRQRVSGPTTIWESSFIYDLQPLLYEQIVSDSGAISHSAVNACAILSTGGNGEAKMQSFVYNRYQPGKGQLIKITGKLGKPTGDVVAQVWYGDGTNGICFESSASGVRIKKVSGSDQADETIEQKDWNIDPMMSGPNTLDITKEQIFVIDAQWLGVGRVRVGFVMDGELRYVHYFTHANKTDYVYMSSFTLPIMARVAGTSAHTMQFICTAVESEGGVDNEAGFEFSQESTITAGSGARTHVISLQPKTTFNAVANRSKIVLESINVLVTGTNPVIIETCFGQALTGTTAMIDVNTTYSGMQYNILGTLSGDPAIIADRFYLPASVQFKSSLSNLTTTRYPLTLNAAGAARALGRMTLLATGLGGTSAIRVSVTWREIR